MDAVAAVGTLARVNVSPETSAPAPAPASGQLLAAATRTTVSVAAGQIAQLQSLSSSDPALFESLMASLSGPLLSQVSQPGVSPLYLSEVLGLIAQVRRLALGAGAEASAATAGTPRGYAVYAAAAAAPAAEKVSQLLSSALPGPATPQSARSQNRS